MLAGKLHVLQNTGLVNSQSIKQEIKQNKTGRDMTRTVEIYEMKSNHDSCMYESRITRLITNRT
jgi:hypothetical protein